MAPSRKAKASGVSSSSFFDLQAEIAKHEADFAKNKASGQTTLVGGVKRPDKKPTVWARHNKGVQGRASKDVVELEAISKPTLEAARAILERKAQVYEKLSKGKSGGLTDKQVETLLVDFDSKVDHYESDSDDVDESLTVPKPPVNDDDPIIEYEDEFGRLRTGRKSEVPRHLLPKDEAEENEEDYDPYVVYNPVDHYPTYQPSEERVAEIEASLAEENNPLNIHYDASQEVRAKGAGFYQFSGDEETRRRQMEELKRAREETEKTREETGAVDLRPGEVEGMVQESGGSGEQLKKSRAMEKRKRELEERRKMLEAKRRKKNPDAEHFSVKAEEREHKVPVSPPKKVTSTQAPLDPFAALEVQASASRPDLKGKGKAKEDPADIFLAALERDMMTGSER